jgi:toxin ParE1/3/4
MMPVQVSGLIESELEDIGDYIARHSPTRAHSFVRELRATIRGIGDDPWLYPLRPELGVDTRVRIHGQYLILFRVVQQTVFVDHVVHGARDASRIR